MLACRPIFSSMRPMLKPGVPASTMKALIWPDSASRSVRAVTMYVSATPALVMNRLDPFTTQQSASRSARVRVPRESLPAPGSVRPYAPSFSPEASGRRYRSFCSCVPAR